jgi:hypothetical protein
MNATYSPVPELNLLKELQDRLGFENYAEGFGLSDYDDDSGLAAGWSKDPEFLAGLIGFAQANGSGSIYALWRLDDRPDLATLPVVVFGDEGGLHVVARDLRELLRLLALDSEISVDWDDAHFYSDAEEEHSNGHAAYVSWLAEHFDLTAPEDHEALVTAAQEELGQRFAQWARPFLPSWVRVSSLPNWSEV